MNYIELTSYINNIPVLVNLNTVICFMKNKRDGVGTLLVFENDDNCIKVKESYEHILSIIESMQRRK